MARSRLNQSPANSIAHQARSFMNVKFPHESRAVGFSSFRTDSQQTGYIPCGLSFTDQLQHLPLPARQRIPWRDLFREVGVNHRVRDARAQVEPSAAYLMDGMNQVIGRLIF